MRLEGFSPIHPVYKKENKPDVANGDGAGCDGDDGLPSSFRARRISYTSTLSPSSFPHSLHSLQPYPTPPSRPRSADHYPYRFEISEAMYRFVQSGHAIETLSRIPSSRAESMSASVGSRVSYLQNLNWAEVFDPEDVEDEAEEGEKAVKSSPKLLGAIDIQSKPRRLSIPHFPKRDDEDDEPVWKYPFSYLRPSPSSLLSSSWDTTPGSHLPMHPTVPRLPEPPPPPPTPLTSPSPSSPHRPRLPPRTLSVPAISPDHALVLPSLPGAGTRSEAELKMRATLAGHRLAGRGWVRGGIRGRAATG